MCKLVIHRRKGLKCSSTHTRTYITIKSAGHVAHDQKCTLHSLAHVHYVRELSMCVYLFLYMMHSQVAFYPSARHQQHPNTQAHTHTHWFRVRARNGTCGRVRFNIRTGWDRRVNWNRARLAHRRTKNRVRDRGRRARRTRAHSDRTRTQTRACPRPPSPCTWPREARRGLRLTAHTLVYRVANQVREYRET